MLKHLSISNYVLIRSLDVDLNKGMTVIAGETGAGKSIILGAMSLLLGSRSDTKSLIDKSRKCIIEGTFDLKGNKNIRHFFTVNDIDYYDDCIIRREITPDGRSRAFVNDLPVKLNVLKDLTDNLIDVHSQHETLTLNSSGFRLEVLDSFAGNQKLISRYSEYFQKFQEQENHLMVLTDQQGQLKRDEDYHSFLYNELVNANISGIIQDELESELELLSNSGQIIQVVSEVEQCLDGSDNDLMSQLNNALHLLSTIARHHPQLADIESRIKSCSIELKDVANELGKMTGVFNTDPEKEQLIRDKLDEIYRLHQKHHTRTIEELLIIQDELKEKLDTSSSLDTQIEYSKKELIRLESELREMALELSGKRNSATPELENEINTMLPAVGLKNAVFKISVKQIKDDGLSKSGIDLIDFLFSANKGVPFQELERVASGGELSRLMLCIKSVLAKASGLPTIVFDEIDTGISGETANKVADIIKQMSKHRQVLVISHLPQMAAKGDDQFLVAKSEKNNISETLLKRLKPSERIIEIAKMLSGESPSESALNTAKELLEA